MTNPILIPFIYNFGWILDIVSRPQNQKGFILSPKRWIIERIYGRLH